MKVPINLPNWDANDEIGRRNMRDYRSLIITGIKESVPRVSNVKLAFEAQQEKDETPTTWLERLKKKILLHSSIDPESHERQVLLRNQFVVKSWPDIRRKLEKIEDWHDKNLNDLLKEAQKVYLRREEEKTKAKAKIMVAIAKESRTANDKRSERIYKDKRETPEEVDKKIFTGMCYYCGLKGHMKCQCWKWKLDQEAYKESQINHIEDYGCQGLYSLGNPHEKSLEPLVNVEMGPQGEEFGFLVLSPKYLTHID